MLEKESSWIELTKADGEPIYVNMAQVIAIRPPGDNQNTKLVTASGIIEILEDKAHIQSKMPI